MIASEAKQASEFKPFISHNLTVNITIRRHKNSALAMLTVVLVLAAADASMSNAETNLGYSWVLSGVDRATSTHLSSEKNV